MIWKVAIFYCKRHILAWIHAVWAILREGWLGVCPPEVSRKSQKVTRGSHGNEVSPLTQGLRYCAACDINLLTYLLTYTTIWYRRHVRVIQRNALMQWQPSADLANVAGEVRNKDQRVKIIQNIVSSRLIVSIKITHLYDSCQIRRQNTLHSDTSCHSICSPGCRGCACKLLGASNQAGEWWHSPSWCKSSESRDEGSLSSFSRWK